MVAVLTLTLVVFVTACSIAYEINRRKKVKSKWCKFAIQTSFYTLFELRTGDQDFKLVDGLKVLCLLWIMIFGCC